jgi:hypothetical protein
MTVTSVTAKSQFLIEKIRLCRAKTHPRRMAGRAGPDLAMEFLQVQRVMAAKDLRAAQNSTVIGAALKMMVPLIVTLPELLGLAVLSQQAGITLVSESEAQATGMHSYNEVLPLMMARYLGPGLLGLGVTGMTPLPSKGPCAWYRRPVLWAGLVAAFLIAVNIIFW